MNQDCCTINVTLETQVENFHRPLPAPPATSLSASAAPASAALVSASAAPAHCPRRARALVISSPPRPPLTPPVFRLSAASFACFSGSLLASVSVPPPPPPTQPSSSPPFLFSRIRLPARSLSMALPRSFPLAPSAPRLSSPWKADRKRCVHAPTMRSKTRKSSAPDTPCPCV
jgi:hypothetical protein